jgi:hypothetical protein
MTVHKRMYAAAAALSALVLAGSASATVVTATFTGTVLSGTDDANLFGGGDLSGLGFKSVYTFDTSIGLGDEVPAYAPGEGRIGSSGFITGESLTINGLTHSENFTSHNEVVYDPFGFADVFYGAYGPVFATQHLNNSLSYGGFHSFTETGSGTAANQGSSFAFLGGSLATTGQLDTQRVTLAGPGAVPEPASWALMLLGFGTMGAMLRHRQRNSSPDADATGRA